MSERRRTRQSKESQALDLLRGRILSGIHSGHITAGDQAPTYREVADETGLDLRAVNRIYGALEKEGLVEVRGRQGVFIAPQERLGGRVPEETARWVIGILNDAWVRRIHLPDLPEFLRKCIVGVQVRCACIESTADQLYAICTELNRDFGLVSSPVHVDQLAAAQAAIDLRERVPPELREADFLVTTAFHASTAREFARRLEKPLVVIRLNPDLVRHIERRLAAGELTVVCVDPRFLERMRLVFGGDHAERIRGILADDQEAVRRLDPKKPVHVTSLARERLKQIPAPVLFTGDHAAMSPESAAELAEMLVRINLEAMRERS